MYYGGIKMNTSITVRIGDEMKNELEKLSKYEHRAVSDLIRDSLEKYISIQKFRKLRSKVLPFAESQGILTDEDVFNLIS